MASLLLRKRPSFTPLLGSHFLSRLCSFCSKASAFIDKTNGGPANYSTNVHLSPLFSNGGPYLGAYDIEVVDNDTWQVSSGLAHAWRGLDKEIEGWSANQEFDKQVYDLESLQGDPDFDEIDNMRIRGNLFYKLDRDSKEFEEYSFDFHRKKSSKRLEDPKGKDKKEYLKKNYDRKVSKTKENDPKGKDKKECLKKNDDLKVSKKKENPSFNSSFGVEKLPQITKNGRVYSLLLDNVDGSHGVEKRRVRAPTFNQLTGPYHQPFCLDIYISKASVRACIIHRATSKVVAVAHSISKDLKFDLPSTKNAATCAAVGAILAQRALADDIHDVIYTPRKGDRVEGKLQIVLQSIIDNGINVKLKLKQRQPHTSSFPQGS